MKSSKGGSTISPYNLSPKAVERWKTELDKLLTGESVTFDSNDPHKLAYRLREAIASAKAHKVAPYDKIDYVFKLSLGLVIAEPRAQLVNHVRLSEQTYVDARNEFDVISVAGKATASILIFPNFSGETGSVHQWARAKGYTVEEDPLILRKKP